MFLDFYHLQQQPFGVTPDPQFIYFSPSHREAIASLHYGIESNRGFGALVADPGMGKTSLLFRLLDDLKYTARTAFLFQPECTPREFLSSLMSDLGIPVQDRSVVQMREALNRTLIEEWQAGRRFLLVVDEAQNLDTEVLESIRLLSNFETPAAKLMHIILAGQPQLAEKLARPELSQLYQRVSSVIRLNRFSAAETAAYIDHRLRVAGREGQPLFSGPALQAVARMSTGIPRNINNICFQALSLGYAMQRPQIDVEILREVSADMRYDAEPRIDVKPRADVEPRIAAESRHGVGSRVDRGLGVDLEQGVDAELGAEPAASELNGFDDSVDAELAPVDSRMPAFTALETPLAGQRPVFGSQSIMFPEAPPRSRWGLTTAVIGCVAIAAIVFLFADSRQTNGGDLMNAIAGSTSAAQTPPTQPASLDPPSPPAMAADKLYDDPDSMESAAVPPPSSAPQVREVQNRKTPAHVPRSDVAVPHVIWTEKPETLFQIALEHYGKANFTIIDEIRAKNPNIKDAYQVIGEGQAVVLPPLPAGSEDDPSGPNGPRPASRPQP